MITSRPCPALLGHVARASTSHVQLGDLPTWLLAGFALLALVAAVAAYFEQRKAGRELANQVSTQADALADQQKATAALARLAELQGKTLEDQQKVNALHARIIERELHAVARSDAERVRVVHELMTYPRMPVVISPNGRYHLVKVTKVSGRPIRDIACRLYERKDYELRPTGLHGWVARFDSDTGSPPARVLEDLGADGRIRALPPGEIWGFVFPADPAFGEVLAVVHLTDDAGLDWQVDDELSLEPLAERDW